MADMVRYWALCDVRYPAGDAEYAKAVKGESYKEIQVKTGDELVGVPEKSIKALLSMGRDVITTEAPVVPEQRKKTASKGTSSDDDEKVVEE